MRKLTHVTAITNAKLTTKVALTYESSTASIVNDSIFYASMAMSVALAYGLEQLVGRHVATFEWVAVLVPLAILSSTQSRNVVRCRDIEHAAEFFNAVPVFENLQLRALAELVTYGGLGGMIFAGIYLDNTPIKVVGVGLLLLEALTELFFGKYRQMTRDDAIDAVIVVIDQLKTETQS